MAADGRQQPLGLKARPTATAAEQPNKRSEAVRPTAMATALRSAERQNDRPSSCPPMPRNIEIKARVDDLDALAARVAAIATSGPTAIAQDDTFFPCPAGRLKLRELADGTGQLIFY